MTDARPDPDALLARIQDQDARAQRGTLKVFFGASPGVGKTYAMLADARRQREQGRDVVIGVVETHGRQDTARLLAGLDVLPRRSIDNRGTMLDEFDLDAALARKPSLLLVDELAHTNAPGSRHPKRYQDVLELLAAGVDVNTTVNVQHIESLNDIVGGITGIKVRETLPDRIFDQADEVVLVDLPPDDLLQRLREGKVYMGEQAERAVQNFFRKGNLLALRELALRRTADRVDTQMRSYRNEHVAGAPVWQAGSALLASVGPRGGDDAVVRAAARLAAALNSRWHAVFVDTPALAGLPEAQRKSVFATLKLAQELGAQTATVRASEPATGLVEYARTHNLGTLVLGQGATPRNRLLRWRDSTFARASAHAPDLDFLAIARAPDPAAKVSTAQPRITLAWRPYGGALALSAAATLLAWPLSRTFDLANIVMLFLLAVVGAALLFGRGPAVLAAIVNVLAFDFFFVPPRFSFAVSDAQYLFTFAIMLVVGIAVGELTARLRFQAHFAARGAEQARQLFEMARELSAALAPEQVAEIGEQFVTGTARAKCAVLTLDEDETLWPAATAGAGPAVDMAIARWCVDHAEPAGTGTDTLPASGRLYLPLKAPVRTRGVLVVEPEDAATLMVPEQRRLLETCAALIAIALERVHFVAVAQRTLVDMESERLRNSVLSALSHDLRTPLTALVGLSETLAHELARGDAGGGEAKALAIRDQARRTARLVDNLLEMARLEAGRVDVRKDWQSLEELVGSALAALETSLVGRAVEVALPADLPLVSCDGALIERVFVNLIENATKYTPPGTPIRIAARADRGEFEVAIEDRGPGLPPGGSVRFSTSSRAATGIGSPGRGIGPRHRRAIVEAHRGTIRAENRDGGGARFAFTLPADEPPPAPAEPEVE